MRDCGVKDVVIAARPGASAKKAEAAGFKVMSVAEAAKWADVMMMVTPDELQADIYKNDLAQNMKQGAALLFAHGFNIHFKLIEPRADLDVLMVAPKGPGHTVRSEYQKGGGVPCLIAVHQDASGNAHDLGLAYASRHRRRPRRRHRDQLPRGMRDRPVRRAGRCCAAAWSN